MKDDNDYDVRAEKRGVFNFLAFVCLVALVAIALLSCGGCSSATPHSPTRVLPQSPLKQSGIDSSSGYVYDELLSDSGISLDQGGKIAAVSPTWARKALGRVLDLQQALDECQAERRALAH